MGNATTLALLKKRYERRQKAAQAPPTWARRLQGRESLARLVLRAVAEADGPLTREALALAAWRLDRAAFGLTGHEEEHPDTNRVWAYLCGRRGLIARGLLARRPDGCLEVTAAGRAALAQGQTSLPWGSRRSWYLDAYAQAADPLPAASYGPAARDDIEALALRLQAQFARRVVTDAPGHPHPIPPRHWPRRRTPSP